MDEYRINICERNDSAWTKQYFANMHVHTNTCLNIDITKSQSNNC